MELVKGDYVSGVWVCQSGDAIWSISLIRRLQAGVWEIAFTWDKMSETGQGVCRTLVHRVLSDGGLSEELSIARVEQIVGTIEAQRQCIRLAYIEIKSGDPETVLDRLYEAAKSDERLGYLIVVRDQLPHS